jgi:hypothetical protein
MERMKAKHLGSAALVAALAIMGEPGSTAYGQRAYETNGNPAPGRNHDGLPPLPRPPANKTDAELERWGREMCQWLRRQDPSAPCAIDFAQESMGPVTMSPSPSIPIAELGAALANLLEPFSSPRPPATTPIAADFLEIDLPDKEPVSTGVRDGFRDSGGDLVSEALDDLLEEDLPEAGGSPGTCNASVDFLQVNLDEPSNRVRYEAVVRHDGEDACSVGFDIGVVGDSRFAGVPAPVALGEVPRVGLRRRGEISLSLTAEGTRMQASCSPEAQDRLRQTLEQEKDRLLQRYDHFSKEIQDLENAKDELDDHLTLAGVGQAIEVLRAAVSTARFLIPQDKIFSTVECTAVAAWDWMQGLGAECVLGNMLDIQADNCASDLLKGFATFIVEAMGCAGAKVLGQLTFAESVYSNATTFDEFEVAKARTRETIEMVEYSLRRYRATRDRIANDQSAIQEAVDALAKRCQVSPVQLSAQNLTCSCPKVHRLP